MKILVADDHALFREGVIHILQGLDENVISIESNDVEQTLGLVAENDDLDLLLMDLYMPGQNGFDALDILTNSHPALPIVVLSASNNPHDMQKTIQKGAMGFIRKDSTGSVMLNALRLVLAGEIYTPSQMMITGSEQRHHLTQRQLEVLQLLEQGCANKIIAGQLNISEATVKMHISAIFRELMVSNRTQAVLKALEKNILCRH
jgi:DNA-binding NarL/FixJ family response regulator